MKINGLWASKKIRLDFIRVKKNFAREFPAEGVILWIKRKIILELKFF